MLPQPGSAVRVGISESSGMAGPHSASLLVSPSREDSWEGERLLEDCVFTLSLSNCLQCPWAHSKGPAPQFSWSLACHLPLCPSCNSDEWFQLMNICGNLLLTKFQNQPPVFYPIPGFLALIFPIALTYHAIYFTYFIYLSLNKKCLCSTCYVPNTVLISLLFHLILKQLYLAVNIILAIL